MKDNKEVNINVRVTRDFKDKLTSFCKQMDISNSVVVRQAIAAYFQNDEAVGDWSTSRSPTPSRRGREPATGLAPRWRSRVHLERPTARIARVHRKSDGLREKHVYK